jgi:hypothetical protein
MCQVRQDFSSYIKPSHSGLLSFVENRYFESDNALNSHWKSKVHKRRCRDLKEPAYTIEESERAAGLGRENARPKSTTMSDA